MTEGEVRTTLESTWADSSDEVRVVLVHGLSSAGETLIRATYRAIAILGFREPLPEVLDDSDPHFRGYSKKYPRALDQWLARQNVALDANDEWWIAHLEFLVFQREVCSLRRQGQVRDALGSLGVGLGGLDRVRDVAATRPGVIESAVWTAIAAFAPRARSGGGAEDLCATVEEILATLR